ncbi:MAG: glutamine--tRNA ligase/YqeY domain fusion protein [Bacteroidales bacterium]|nr:glutamine--tRNA ligase/YqeY domain fusion protein [Bacteroidales bacterium]MCB9013140.1 glutamine--tRNA ligase/YqeY domain fusion protein [Bacteroidales bacterium]
MNTASGEPVEEKKSLNFLEQLVEEDVKAGKNNGKVHTRFPPEPNGYLHIGHAKAICIDFGMAKDFGGKTNLRFDDTNPAKEETEYVDSIKEDIKWLGFDWDDREFYASDYFEQLYNWAVKIIKAGNAYVDDQSSDTIAEQKGTPTTPGTESPFRNRSVEENLDLFERMKNGEFEEGSKVLRAKIDMASSNMHLRDPLMYRILKKAHHRTGNKWCIYPMYDYAHGQSDYIEGITHSLCTLEFEVHRPLYNWFLEQVYEEGKPKPRQIEFARLNLSYTIMSKRKLLELVKDKHVSGWDDPRMPTLSGMRRRGYTPASIRNFVDTIGVTKTDGVSDVLLLEHSVRDDLNKIAPRVMAVLNPLKMIITNYPEGKTEELETPNNPEDENAGSRMIPFSREIYIEQEDFMIDPPGKFFRLAPGKEVRLKSAFIVRCDDYKMNSTTGEPEEIYCSYFPETRSGGSEANRKVKGTLHWVSVPQALKAEVRLYDRLFSDPEPDGHKDVDFKEFLNPDSLKVSECYVEPGLATAKALEHFQFQRIGYFNVDPDSRPGKLVFNRTVALKDSWAKAGA